MPPETSFPAGHKLYEAIRAVTKLEGDNWHEKTLGVVDALNITNSLQEFETVFAAEYARKDTFYVSKKGIYSTSELIEQAENMFPPEIQARIPTAMPEIKEAGRCLAFQLPTAAAFHLFRAVEAVSRRYVQVVRGTAPTGRQELGIGNHVRILRTNGGADERVINALDQFRRLHRNPNSHPEELLTMSEVLFALGIVQSVILGMVADMETKAQTPEPAIAEMLPDADNLDPVADEGDGTEGAAAASATPSASS
jgi:hypothetical protein